MWAEDQKDQKEAGQPQSWWSTEGENRGGGQVRCAKGLPDASWARQSVWGLEAGFGRGCQA